MTSPAPYHRQGTASWYGRKFHGQRTTGGEVYDKFALSAAHPTLPIPSYARVTNLVNHKSVVVRINHRGPFGAGRIMDVSYAAAHRLGFVEEALAHVEVEALLTASVAATSTHAPATPAPSDPVPRVSIAMRAAGVFLQLGAFAN